jgi:hypothetical protein
LLLGDEGAFLAVVYPTPLLPIGGLSGNELAVVSMSGNLPFAAADEPTLQEILREAESYLSAQLTASIAADQRAVGFASLLAAATAVLIATGGALLLGATSDTWLGWACMAVAAAFLAAMALANLSAMPADFWYVGNSPAQWVADVQSSRPLKESLAEQLTHYAQMIKDNDRLMRRNNKQMLWAIWLSWGALAIGGVVGIALIAIRQYKLGPEACGSALGWH